LRSTYCLHMAHFVFSAYSPHSFRSVHIVFTRSILYSPHTNLILAVVRQSLFYLVLTQMYCNHSVHVFTSQTTFSPLRPHLLHSLRILLIQSTFFSPRSYSPHTVHFLLNPSIFTTYTIHFLLRQIKTCRQVALLVNF
jgi:hypothetical protein